MRIVLDNIAIEKLRDLNTSADLCDEQGKVIGRFFPPLILEMYRRALIEFTDEELDRYEQEPGGRSLAEILADLEKMN